MQFDFPSRPLHLPVARVFTVATLLLAMNSIAFAQNQPAEQPPAGKKASTSTPAVAPAGPSILAIKAQPGQVRKGRGIAKLSLASGPQKMTLDIKETSKQSFTKVAPNGDVTYEEVTESSETLINDQKPPADPSDDKKDTNTVVVRPNGMLVSYTSTKEDKDDVKFAARLFYATNPVFTEIPVSMGSKWSITFKGNPDLGTKDGKADYEIVEAKKIGDVDTVRIKFTYAETVTGGVTSKGTMLIEKASGDTLSSEIEIEGVPLGPPGQESPASGKLISERTDGGPLANSKNVAWLSPNANTNAAKTIDEVVKDYEKLPGLLTIYRKKEGARETIYLEVPEDKLNRPFFLQATASTGSAEEVIAGDPINDILFKFTKSGDDKLMMTAPNWYYRADPNTPLGKAVKRSFSDGYLQTFKIEAKQPNRKSMLIDISDFFRSDFAQISQFVNGGEGGGGGGGLFGMSAGGGFSMDREKTAIQSLKNFPENIVVFTQYHFQRSRANASSPLADSRSLPLVVAYNLIALPNDENYKPTNGYEPRKADPRVGFFRTEYMNFDDDSRDDFTNRFIIRWDLKKKDPTAAISEPVKPIVFWLDNAIPTEYRDVVKRALLVWNKAFEKAGFKDAIQVNQMPDNADWDHADLRYNIVRWVVTPPDSSRHGVAIALFRSNPLTGQILNANISVDASWTQIGKLQRRNLIDPAAKFREGANLDMEDMLSGTTPITEDVKARLQQRTRHFNDPRSCEIGAGLEEKGLFGEMALDLTSADGISPQKEKEYTDQLLQETVTHEMGHILGLTHNFIASTELSLDQLKDPALVKEHGISASVMDYNNFNISAIGKEGVDYYSQAVGTYDTWAIGYGYMPFSESEEATGLKKIASESNLPGHAYEEDVTAMVGLDPRVVQYDMSSQPLDYWEQMLKLSRRLMMTLEVREPKQGESYWEFTRRLQGLLGSYSRAAGVASRYIGGIKLNRNHRGDPNEQPTTVSTDVVEEKRALSLLNNYVFSPTALAMPEQYYSHLTNDPFNPSLSQDQPVGDQLASIQTSALKRIFAPSVLRRLQNGEFKSGSNTAKVLTLPTLFSSVRENIWAEVTPAPVAKTATTVAVKGVNIRVPLLRRQLQRSYLDTMIDMATKPGSAPDDAKMLAWEQLRLLKGRLAAVQPSQVAGDEYTRLHVKDSLDKVTRALDAKLVLGAQQGGGAPVNLLQLLLGGKQ